MKTSSLVRWLLSASVGVVALTVLVPQIPAAAQDGSQYIPSILPDGQPDIQGIYVSPWRVPIEHWTDAEREEWGEQMVSVRGPNPGAYGLEWTESRLRQDNPTEDMVAVVDPADGRVP
jgi:hypothetical protein